MIWRVDNRQMDEKITIIEGPPPTFEIVNDGWVLSLNESPNLFNIATTSLRTFNGAELVERCYRAWHNQSIINLEFRGGDGLENQAPILAARALEVDEGQVLLLWVRLGIEETKFETDLDNESDDDFGFPDL